MKKIHINRRAIVFLVIVQYYLTIGYASDEAGCFHNGTLFADGSLVPSVEPCLSCRCFNTHLICSLRMCAEQPIPPPRGCVLVHKKSSCCPHLSCRKYHDNENHNRKVITYNIHWYNNDADDLNGDIEGRQKMTSKNSLYRRIDDEEIDGNDQRCIIASSYYPEGEKLPTNTLKPCDICFCIRGERICTPKKCAPHIGSCKPKIPEGQCCPSNYECDHSADAPTFRSSHTSRQFDLLSYIFGDESTLNETNKEPIPNELLSSSPQHSSSISTTSEKSFFDAIREGLNFIDSNDEDVEKILDTSTVNSTSEQPLSNNTSQFSFLDIFLSDDDDDDIRDDEYPLHNETSLSFSQSTYSSKPEEHTTFYIHSEHPSLYDSSTSVSENDRYALLDEHNTVYASTVVPDTTNSVKLYDSSSPAYNLSDTEKDIHQFVTFPYSVKFDALTSSTIKDIEGSTHMEPNSEPQLLFSLGENEPFSKFDEESNYSWTSTAPTFTFHDNDLSSETTARSASSSTEKDPIQKTTNTQITDSHSMSHYSETSKMNTTTEDSTYSTHIYEFSHIFSNSNSTKEVDIVSYPPKVMTQHTTTQSTPTLGSDYVENDNITKVSTQIPLLPKTTKRINPTIISSPSYQFPMSSTQPSTTLLITTTSPSTTSSTPKITQTTDMNKRHHTSPKISLMTTTQPTVPTLIDSNPSILEADMNYDYDEPTLPPSLPNLKIIPFLPTDAVQKNNINAKPNYGTIFSENHFDDPNSDFGVFKADGSVVKHKDDSDFSSYAVESTGYSKEPIFGFSNTNVKSSEYDGYPSITEDHSQPNVKQTIFNKYPAYNKYGSDYDYDSFDPGKHLDTNKYVPGSYEVIDGHEYIIQGRNPSFDTYTTDFPERRVYSKIEFSTSNPLFGFSGNNKFSPPSKTEGGFLPKESLQDDQYYDTFHNTKFAIDITTENSPKANLSGLIIGITSEDPFKDVIRTEPPPNLHALIEDKAKLFQKIPEVSITIDHDYPSIHLSDIEKELISFTTDLHYDSTTDGHELLTSYSYNNTSSSNATDSNNERVQNNSVKYSTEISVTINSKQTPTREPATNDFLGSILGYIFKDNKNVENLKPTTATSTSENQTIPPFKKISSTSLTLMDILNFTKPIESSSKKSDVPQRKNNKIYEYPTTPLMSKETQTPKMGNLLRDVLLATLNSPDNIDPSKNIDKHPTIDIPKPIYSTHSIHQFLNPIFSGNVELSHVTNKYDPIRSEIDVSIPKLNSQLGDNKDELINNVFGSENYQVLNDYPSISNSRPFGENPIDYDSLKEQHSDDNSHNTFPKPSNSFQNSIGILKLAGCNIYGRMYRVGRIIIELSNPCLECKCTEVGVHCTPLKC